MKKLLSIVVPCYNEEESIPVYYDAMVKEMQEMNYIDFEIIFINDGSKDKTLEIIRDLAKKDKKIRYVSFSRNFGKEAAMLAGLRASKGDFVTTMDVDLQDPPSLLPEMYKGIVEEGYDCVIASRYCASSDVVGVAKHRVFMSDMAGVYYKMMLNVPNVKDYTCGYRIYTNEIINKLVKDFGKDPIKEKSFACMMELLYKLHLSGAKFNEVGFELRYDNKKGESKMKVLKTMYNSLRVGFYLRRKGKKLMTNEKDSQ